MIVNQYFQEYTSPNYMEQSYMGYGYVVHSSIMERYYDMNNGLKTKQG
jgi:hypothetical protein